MMFIMQILISFLPLLIINSFFKEKENFKKILNLFYYMSLSLIILMVYDSFIKQFFTIIYKNFYSLFSNSLFLLVFTQKFLYTAFPEEIIKFLAIKNSKPQNKWEIIRNSMLIATIFMFYENFSYASEGILLGVWRIIIPIHIVAQMIMAYYLGRTFDEKENGKLKYHLFTFFSLLLPILIHTIYNCYAALIPTSLGKGLIILFLGIASYILAFKFIKNTRQKFPESQSENEEKVSGFKMVLMILITLFWIYTFML